MPHERLSEVELGELMTWKPDDLRGFIRGMDWQLHQMERLLDLIPECPAHGPDCISHAVEWLAEHIGQMVEG